MKLESIIFLFLSCNDVGLPTDKGFSHFKFSRISSAAAFKRLSNIFDKEIKIKEDKLSLKINIKKSNIVFENVGFKYENTNEGQ